MYGHQQTKQNPEDGQHTIVGLPEQEPVYPAAIKLYLALFMGHMADNHQ